MTVTLMRNFANSGNARFFKDAMRRDQACQPRILDLNKQCVVCRLPCKKLLPCGRCKAVAYS